MHLDKEPYTPADTLTGKLARKLHRFQARRMLRFAAGRPVVSFSFDDFPRSAALIGAPMLEAEGWRATYYASAGLMGVRNHHGENFAAEDVRSLHASGHEIAGHTHDHIDCSRASLAQIWESIDKNENVLAALGIPAPQHFAYPYGELTPELKRALAARFKSMRGIRAKTHIGAADLNDLKSAPIYTGPELQGTLTMIRDLKTTPGWLTLFTHDIEDQPSEWGCTAAGFAAAIKAVKESGALVLPIGAAISYLEAQNGG